MVARRARFHKPLGAPGPWRWLAALCALAGLAALEVECAPASPRVGERLVWRLYSAPAAWLSDDVERTPRLRLSAPDGTVWERRAVLDQDWRPGGLDEGEFVPAGPVHLSVRHTARQPGRHAWRLLAPDGAVLAEGTLAVQPGARPPGPLGISPDQPRLLAWADGTPFLALGPNLAWGNAPDRIGSFRRWCAALAAQGATHIRLWLASWSGKPWDDAGRLRLDQAWLTDQYLAAARAHGLAVTLVLDNYHDLLQGRGAPWGDSSAARVRAFVAEGPPARWRALVRYALARWGPDDTIACWEPINEIDVLPAAREEALAWLARVTAWLAAEDPDRRPITASWAGEDWEAAMRLPAVQVAQLRGYVHEWTDADWTLVEATRDPLALWSEAAARAQALGKPFLLAEGGFQGAEAENPGNELDREGLLLTQLAWAGLMLGGAGSGMGWWWDSYLERHGLWRVYGPLAAIAHRLDWRDRELAPLAPAAQGPFRILGWASPRQALLWPVHVHDTWHAALVRGRPRPAPPLPVTVLIPGCTPRAAYRVASLSMRDGARRAAWRQAARGDGTLELVLPPGTIDAVFHLEREGP